jgi:hypothetical protein
MVQHFTVGDELFVSNFVNVLHCVLGLPLTLLCPSSRFRMHRHLFHWICRDVAATNPHFMQKPDALSVTGFHPLHKCVVAVKILGHGSFADGMDDTRAMGITLF